MAGSGASSVVSWFGKLLVQEVKYLSQVNQNVVGLQTDLEWMLCLLQDVSTQQHSNNHLAQKWVSDIRDHAYEAEQLIEEYIVKVSYHARNQPRSLFSWETLVSWVHMVKDGNSLHQIGLKIDALSLRISKVIGRQQEYDIQLRGNIRDNNNFPQQKKQAKTRICTKKLDDSIIMLKDDKLVRYLTRNSSSGDVRKMVVVICGMSSLGKTTLAKQVYHQNDMVKTHFSAFSWANVSRKFDHIDGLLEFIVKDLIQQVDDESPMKVEIERYIERREFRKGVNKLLRGMKCLVVLDDIRTSTDFNGLMEVFPFEDNESGSKILVTTRYEKIMKDWMKNSVVTFYKFKGLNRNEALELFQKRMGESWDGQEKEKVGKEILKYCEGVPLVIDVLAATLRMKDGVKAWEDFNHDIRLLDGSRWYPNHISSYVYDVLSMSYLDLPSYLKPCFLHLASFPEGFEIQVENLYRQWIAGGIIPTTMDFNNNEVEFLDEEDKAEMYMKQLVERNMVQVLQHGPHTRIKTCTMNALLLDVCIATAKEEGFVLVSHIVKYGQKKEGCGTSQVSSNKVANGRLFSLAIHLDEGHLLSMSTTETSSNSSSSYLFHNLPKAPWLRSLFLFSNNMNLEEKEFTRIVEHVCTQFPFLRVLEFEGYNITGTFPKQVGNLIHLRNLGLQTTSISRLPSSIHKLVRIQTLDLRVVVFITIPNVLWKLKELKHLYLPDFKDLGLGVQAKEKRMYKIGGGEQLRLDGLIHLHTISGVDLEVISMHILPSLNNMKRLWARCMSKKEALEPFIEVRTMKEFNLRVHPQIINENPHILAACGSLQELDIHSTICESLYLKPLSSGMLPKSLKILSIWGCDLHADPMPILGKLPNLTSASLQGCDNNNELRCLNQSFPTLTDLVIRGFPSLREWIVEDGALSKLRRLEIYTNSIKKLPTSLPSSLSIVCSPCIPGIEKHGSCPHFKPISII